MRTAALPSGLQREIFGNRLSQRMEKLSPPSSSRHLLFGNNHGMDRPLHRQACSSMALGQNWTLRQCFNQSKEKISLYALSKSASSASEPMQRIFHSTVTPDRSLLKQALEQAPLSSGLQISTYIDNLDQHLERASLPSGLQSMLAKDDAWLFSSGGSAREKPK